MQDLFNSRLSLTDLVDIYVDAYQQLHGFPPQDFMGLNRAGMVDLIERLDEEAQRLGVVFQ